MQTTKQVKIGIEECELQGTTPNLKKDNTYLLQSRSLCLTFTTLNLNPKVRTGKLTIATVYLSGKIFIKLDGNYFVMGEKK